MHKKKSQHKNLPGRKWVLAAVFCSLNEATFGIMGKWFKHNNHNNAHFLEGYIVLTHD